MNFTLKDILSTIFRYKTGLLLFSLYLCVGLAVFLLFSKKMYESNAQILVRFGQEQLGSTTLSAADRNIYFTRREQEIQNEIRILTSNDTLMATASQIAGPKASVRELLRIREYLKGNIQASALKDSDILNVTFLFPDPVVAQKALTVILDQYRIHHGAVYFSSSELELLSGKLNEARNVYAEAVKTLTAFEAKYRLYDEKQIVAAHESVESQRIALNTLVSEYAYTVQRRDLIKDALEQVPQNVLFSVREVRNVTYERLNERLAELLMQRQAYLSRYNPDSRTVQDMDKEIGLLKKLLNKQPERLVDDKETRTNETWIQLDQALQSLNPEVEAQKARIESLTAQIAEMDRNLTEAIEARGEHTLLSRDTALKKEIYDRYYQNYSEAIGREAAQQQSITNVSIVELPSLESKVAKPNKKRILALGVIALVAGNIFILFVRYFADNTLSSPEQAEGALKRQVVGVFNATGLKGGEEELIDGLEEPPGFEVHRKNFRQLYLKTVRSGQPASLLFSASDRGSGLNNLAADFAVFAKKYQQRNPVIISYMPDDSAPDEGAGGRRQLHLLTRQYEGVDEYVLSDNVDVPSETDFWKKLKSKYDLLVFNYAPLQESPLLIGLADQLDWVIYDIIAEKTNKFVASNAIETLAQFGFKKIGLVISGRKFHIPMALYRYL